MKTNKVLAGLLLMGGLFTMNGQIATTTLTSYGNLAGTAGSGCTYFGFSAGKVNAGSFNTFIGNECGKTNAGGSTNFFAGHRAGMNNVTGSSNVFLGNTSGMSNTSGGNNTYVGSGAGQFSTTGTRNTYMGNLAGYASGNDNIAVGYFAGYMTNGSNNIFIGNNVGTSATESNKLMIDIASTPTPLIWGDFSTDQLKLNGKVGIGGVTTFPDAVGGVNTSTYKLFVQGGVLATEVRVATTWADYVFEDNYALPSLDEVECFIDENGHLPNVPSAKQVADEGISIGEMAKIQQEKIEELTLYIIAQDKQFKAQQKELNDLKVLVQGLIEKK